MTRTPKRVRSHLDQPMLPDGTQTEAVSTFDSFVNFAQKLGIGADNPLTTATYGYNPITRNRVMLEWIHRGSWIGGIAVDTVANDMTRAGVDSLTDMKPEVSELVHHSATQMGVWNQINEAIRWSRLYGGAILVALVDGQDLRTPLNVRTVGRGQFKGLLTLDRWMVEPDLQDLVTEYGPHLGLPKYYRVQSNAPALRGEAIHYSRVMVRMEGVQLPYQQRVTENLWGTSVLERLYDRMIAFDSASTGAAQLVYKSYLRTLKINGLRDIISAGGKPMMGLYSYVDVMRRFQGMEGITMLDGSDEFEAQGHSAFSGLSDALIQFGQQLSGALQIPLVRLFGQSPAGLNATGESDLRMYYDHINQEQNRHLLTGVTKIYQLLGRNVGYEFPPTFSVDFTPLWQLTQTEKAEIASKDGTTVTAAVDGGLIGRQTALKELRQSSKVTGVFTNITDEMIAEADDEVSAPGIEGLMEGMPGLPGLPGLPGDDEDETRPPQNQKPLDDGKGGRKKLLPEIADAGKAGGRPGQGNGNGPPGNRPPAANLAKLRGLDKSVGRDRRKIHSD